MAQAAGIPADQIQRLNPNALGELIQYAQSRQQAAPAVPAQAPAEPEFDLGLSEDQQEEFGPELMGVLNKIGKETQKELREVKAKLASYEQRESQRTESQVAHSIETAIASLDPAYRELVGQGTWEQVAQAAPDAVRKRKFVLESLQAQGLNFWTASPQEIRDRIKAQIDVDFGPRQAAPANGNQPPPGVTKEQWAQAGSPPPTSSRNGNELPKREGTPIEDRYSGAITEEEVADEKIRASLRRRKQPQQA